MSSESTKLKILDFLLWIFFILSIIFISWYAFGNSPTFEQTLLIFILGFVIANLASLKALKIDHNNLKRSFNALAKDFKEHIKYE